MREWSTTPCRLGVVDFGCIRGGKLLFKHLNFSVQAGQVLVVQGRNGAGKSSLLRSLAGLLPWRAGQLHWCGKALAARDGHYQQQLAYLGHQVAMSDMLSCLENLQFALKMMGVSWSPARALQVLEGLALHAVASRPVWHLSQGQRRRLGLARVVLSQRPMWLLDEPDNVLDLQGAQWLGQALQSHTAQGGLAVVVTHRGLELPGIALQLNLSSLPHQELAAC